MSTLLQRAKSFYGIALSDPAAACTEYLSEDFVLENYLPPGLPFGGRYEGAAGFLKYLGEIAGALDIGPLEMHEWVADANTVVVRGEEQSLVRTTGRRYHIRFVHWLRFDTAGRITHMREFNDTAEMAKAFRDQD